MTLMLLWQLLVVNFHALLMSLSMLLLNKMQLLPKRKWGTISKSPVESHNNSYLETTLVDRIFSLVFMKLLKIWFTPFIKLISINKNHLNWHQMMNCLHKKFSKSMINLTGRQKCMMVIIWFFAALFYFKHFTFGNYKHQFWNSKYFII